MNDRFKFRVWDIDKAKYNTDCNFVLDPDGILGEWDSIGAYEEDEYIVEQCTGLKDKNGNLIYEGDLLTDGRDIGQVLWTGAGWGCTAFLFKKKPETLKICGNIHEQAEQKD